MYMMYVCLYVCMYVCVYIPREFGRNPIRLEKNNLHEAYGLLDWATLYMLETWMNVFLNTTVTRGFSGLSHCKTNNWVVGQWVTRSSLHERGLGV